MKAVDRFNGLNGSVVSRSRLGKLASDAERQGQLHLARRLRGLLARHPEAEMELEIDGYEVQSMPADALHGLEEIALASLPGLSRPVPQDDIYDYVTNLMLDTIREVGHLPWQKQWSGGGSGRSAMNYVSGKEYSGINYLLLNFDIVLGGNGKPILVPVSFDQPYYLTIRQIEQAGAKLRKGSTHRKVIYYTMVMDYRDGTHSIKTSDRKKFEEFVRANGIGREKIDEHLITVPVIKYYRVFRADDCTGLSFPERPETKGDDPIEAAQRIIDGYPDPPDYTFGGDRAFYSPTADMINMPNLSAFSGAPQYYSTFFHEQIHSTGHGKRLDRFSKKIGKDEYAFEELVAELGAVFLCAQAGTLFHTRENSAKYLAGWNRKLVKELENDNRFFLRAAAKAQKAADLILSGKKETVEKKPETGKPIPKPRKRKKGGRQLELALKGKQNHVAQPETATPPEVQPPAAVRTAKPKPAVPDRRNAESVSLKGLEKFGFVSAANVPEKAENLYTLPGEIGQFLQERQPYKDLIIIKGTKHTSKSQLAMQIANAYGEMGWTVGYIDYEQGGMASKDTVDSINRNTTPQGRSNIAVIGFLEKPFEELKEFCKHCKAIVADSVTDLGITPDQLNELRCQYTEVTWIFISQVKENGEMYGGNKMAHNPTCILECHPSEDPRERFATLVKNRGNDLSLKYSMFHKQIIQEQAKPTPETQPPKVDFSFEAVER